MEILKNVKAMLLKITKKQKTDGNPRYLSMRIFENSNSLLNSWYPKRLVFAALDGENVFFSKKVYAHAMSNKMSVFKKRHGLQKVRVELTTYQL